MAEGYRVGVISPERLAAGRDLTEPRLSPSGTHIVFAVTGVGDPHLAVVPVDGGPERRLTTSPVPRPGRGSGGGCFDWTPTGDAVVYLAAGGEIWRQPFPGGEPRRIGVVEAEESVSGVALSPDGHHVLVVADTERVVGVDMATGAQHRIDDGRHDFVIDARWSPDQTAVVWQAWSVPAMPWDGSVAMIARIDPATTAVLDREQRTPAASLQQPRLDALGRMWCVEDASGWLNLTCDSVAVLAENHEHAGPTWGPGQRSYDVRVDDAGDAEVAIARNEAGFGRLVFVARDGAITELGRGVHAQITLGAETVVALRSGARTPTQIVAYDRGTLERRVLAVGPVSGWEDEPALVEPTLIEVTARDAATVHARLYQAPESTGRLIVWVHGGPTDQWTVDFRPRFAMWLERGYDIVVPDHRGSTGHGRAYQQAMNGRWGDLDVADTADVVAHLHASGPWTPATTVAMGSSAGGFTVLWLGARHPDRLAAVVALYPVTDLVDLRRRSHRFERHSTDTLVAPLDSGQDLLVARSLGSAVPALTGVPLLVLHGDQDPVVPVEQSRDLVAAVNAAGGLVVYHEYPDEGHGFRRIENQIDEARRVAAFCESVLSASR
jgi:dipeptidyl aminopeptidase/acylaminoacyl peptidase